MATDAGECRSRLIDLMAGLAKGGVGLIISGHTYVCPEDQAGPKQLGVYKEELIPGLQEMTTAVHENGGKITMQLAHAGIVAASELTGIPPLAPSNLEGIFESAHKEMTAGNIQEMVAAFKKDINVSLILVGGNRSFDLAERLVAEGHAEYISMCRPLIREPDLVNRWKSGDLSKAACVSDNLCFQPARKGEGVFCLTEERQKGHA
ncbi:NADH:flavin oxidoreductase/NADH oxidase [Olavius sp. associated proteobacterium Delta 1]|nr:NADH:flavin oxidoreductase/NADH oxidase [Olavius sp. associated proteobacterium Delta 1]